MLILVLFVAYMSVNPVELAPVKLPEKFLSVPSVKKPFDGVHLEHLKVVEITGNSGIHTTLSANTAVRHVSQLWKNKYPISHYVDSDSSAAVTENSIESQRQAFNEMLDKHQRNPKKQKQFHSATKIKLKFDYINRKYSIIELSSEEE